VAKQLSDAKHVMKIEQCFNSLDDAIVLKIPLGN